MAGKALNSKNQKVMAGKAAFNKRKHCLKKKTFELSTLCEIDACILFVGPDGEIDTWPPEKHELDLIIKRYRSAGISEEELKKQKKNRGRGGKKQSNILNILVKDLVLMCHLLYFHYGDLISYQTVTPPKILPSLAQQVFGFHTNMDQDQEDDPNPSTA